MKLQSSLLISITAILISVLLPHAYSDIVSGTKYLLEAPGFVAGTQTIQASQITLQFSTGSQISGTAPITLENGVVTISGNDYLNSGIWETTFLRDNRFLVISGDAIDANGNTIHVNLFGRYVYNNADGSVYTLTGKITTPTDTLRVSYSARLSATVVIPSTPTSQPTQNQTQGQTTQISILPGANNINNPQQQFFSPSSLQIVPGTTIVWTNNDSVSHRIMSGTASAIGTNSALPAFTLDGKIDSGIIAPGQSYKITINSFDNKTLLSPAMIKYLNLSTHQASEGITFFDPTYPWMIGAITPIPTITSTQAIQISISFGAYNPNNGQFLLPSSAQITPGSAVIWKNDDSVPHRIMSGNLSPTTQGQKGSATPHTVIPSFIPDRRIDSGTIATGQTFQTTINGVGSTTFFDPTYPWINGIVTSLPQTASQTIPIQVSILPGSSLSQGSASQSNQFYYNNYYSPSDIQIVPGTTIVWTNNDSVSHRIMSGISTQKIGNPFTPDGKIDSGIIAPGQSFQTTINATGILRFFDPTYNWMNGIIISIPPASYHVIGAASHNPNLH